MARRSRIAANERRKLVVACYAARRAALRALIGHPSTAPADGEAAAR
ncbi:hypothetical protein ACIQUQ_09285 [Streptomyces sp. NPDC101118]